MAVNADNVFRDFVIDGAPSSGAHKPKKVEIRELFTQIDDAIDQVNEDLDTAVEDLTALITTGSKQTGPVAVATTANITLSGPQTIDGVLTSTSRVLVKNQSTPSQNGIYVSNTGAWTRATDMDAAAEFPGLQVLVLGGSTNAGKNYVCTNTGTVTVGTTAITFVQNGQPASVVPSLSSGALVTDPVNTQIVLLNSAGTATQRITYADLLAKINGDVMPATEYTFSGSDTVSTSAKIILYSDPTQTRAFVQNLSTTETVAIASSGRQPSINNVGRVLGPGAGTEFNPLPPGNLVAIASGSAQIDLDYSNTSGVDPNAAALADQHLARYSATLTTPQRTAIKNLYVALDSAGVFDRNGRVAVYSAPNTSDALLKWGRTGSYSRVSVPTAGWAGMTFDGIDDAVDLGEVMTSFAGINDHTILYWTDDTIQGSGRYAGGDSGTRVGPNRTTTQSGMHDLSSVQVVTVGGLGGLQGVTRTTTGKFTAHRDIGSTHFEQEISVTDTAAGTQTFYDGAIHVAGGWSSGYSGVIKFRYIGLSLTQSQRYAVAAALNTYFTATAGF